MLKKRNQKGFTIIEVLIVLAIAALILIIIFFAVPALQRNNRNTQIRNDAAVLLGFVNDYAANNNGGLPPSGVYNPSGGYVCLTAPGGTVLTAANCTASATGYVGNIRGGLVVNITANTSASATAVQPTNTGEIRLALNGKCSGNTLGTTATYSNRAVSAGFQTETAAATASDQCTQS